MDRSDLVGTWRLRSWDSVFDDGSVGNIMGETPVGVIVYTADRTVIVTISASGRPPIEGNDPLAPTSSTMLRSACIRIG